MMLMFRGPVSDPQPSLVGIACAVLTVLLLLWLVIFCTDDEDPWGPIYEDGSFLDDEWALLREEDE